MDRVLTWLAINWELIVVLATVAINVLNFATSVWHTNDGLKKWALFAVSVLSVIRTAGSEKPLKLPLVPEK